MTQIIDRRTGTPRTLGTQSGDTSVTLDTIYGTLLHKAFLFEYRARIPFSFPGSIQDLIAGSGVQVCLIASGLSDADLNAILDGAQITDQNMNVEIPSRQQLFAVADAIFEGLDSADNLVGHFNLDFKPRSKGGIPFSEGSGWSVVLINRIGTALTTGAFIGAAHIYQRFAYEGAGGA